MFKQFAALAATLALAAPAAFSLDLKGMVVDAAGEPVAGARVWLCQGLDVHQTESDGGGAFVFGKVRPESAAVVAKKDGHSLGGADVPVPGAGPVAVVLGEPDTLEVVVKNHLFEPLPGACVTRLVLNGMFAVPVAVLAEKGGFEPIVSGEDGVVELDCAPRGGTVGLVLSHRSYATTFAPFLKAGEQQPPVQMHPGAEVRGRVLSPDAAGVPGARVALYRADGGAFAEPVVVLADPEGFYHVIVKPGEYYIAARHSEYASPEPEKTVLPGGHESTVVNLTLPAPHLIEGKVLLPDGRPCPNVAVSYMIDGSLYDETLTQHDGSFRFLAPQREGAVRVAAPPGYTTAEYYETPIKGALPERITLTPTRLVELPVLEGKIKDADGAPAADALVTSLGLSLQARALTDLEGRFKIRMLQAPPDGRVRFRAEHARRFQRAEFEVDFKDVEPVDVTLQVYEPDLSSQPPQRGENDLTEFVGEPPPALSCDGWLNSNPLTLDELKGRVVVLAFWGGFDDRLKARDVLNELRAVYDIYKSVDDVAVVSVHDSGSETEQIRSYVEAFNIDFPVGCDTHPGQTFAHYRVRYIPQVVLLDKAGKLRYFQTRGRLLELIKTLRRE